MPQDTDSFIEALIQGYMQSGLSRSMSQILVFLTVCEPAEQTAKSIQQRLNLSAGSVSTALSVFVAAGLVSHSKPAGSKHYVYELKSEAWERSIAQRITAVEHLATIAERGTKLLPGNTRLRSMHDIYFYFGTEFKDWLQRYRNSR